MNSEKIMEQIIALKNKNFVARDVLEDLTQRTPGSVAGVSLSGCPILTVDKDLIVDLIEIQIARDIDEIEELKRYLQNKLLAELGTSGDGKSNGK